jgi:hypothetical protein
MITVADTRVTSHAAIAVLAAVAACTSSEGNPSTLWLAATPDEMSMLLVGEQPHPY